MFLMTLKIRKKNEKSHFWGVQIGTLPRILIWGEYCVVWKLFRMIPGAFQYVFGGGSHASRENNKSKLRPGQAPPGSTSHPGSFTTPHHCSFKGRT